MPPGKKFGNAASSTSGIRGRKHDKNGNPYPKRNQCYITVANTEKSNNNLTKLIPKKVVLPLEGAGVPADEGDHQVGVLWYEFKAHSCS